MLARNVLIFHAGALGDFVLSWPLGLALGRLFPQSRIIYVTQKQKGLLAEKVLRLDWTDMDAGWHHLFGDPQSLPPNCHKMLAGSHAVFTYLSKKDHPWLKNATTIAPKAEIVPVSAIPETPGEIHATKILLDSLSPVPVIRAAVEQILSSIAANGIRFSRNASGPILIHPGSGGAHKCWPLESFITLIEILKAKGKDCRILLGEVEMERWSPDIIQRLKSTAPVAQPPTYLDLLTEFSTATAFIGNDSGPAHLAAIIGTPTITLFGPTNPAVWKPLGPKVTTIHQPLETLSPQQVAQTVISQ